MDDELHRQDWLLIIEALTAFGGPPDEIETPREEYAWKLAEKVADDQRLDTTEVMQQLDVAWPR